MSDSNGRGELLTAGGVLSIIGGALQIIAGLIIAGLMIVIRIVLRLALFPVRPGEWFDRSTPALPPSLAMLGVPIIALGIVAIIGGVSALRRTSFGLSLAGAICALPSNILGILAIVFVSLSKKEFEVSKKELEVKE